MRHRLPLLLLALIACEDGVDGVQPRMDFSNSRDFFASPFPNEHRRDENGLRLGSFPNPERIDFVDSLIRAAAETNGFGTTSAIYFPLTDKIQKSFLPDVVSSTEPDAGVFLMNVERGSADFLQRHPIDVDFKLDGGPYAAVNLLSLLPLQGAPLRPGTLYAAVVLRKITNLAGERMGVAPEMLALSNGETPTGMTDEVAATHRSAIDALAEAGLDVNELSGLTVFRTAEPTKPLERFRDQLLAAPLPQPDPFALIETYDDFCVFQSSIEMPIFQEGRPPFSSKGGGWVIDSDGLVSQGTETANFYVTVPRRPMPASGFPTVHFIRTGGGGDRPLIDRGVRAEPGGPTAPGSGPAGQFARVGWAGLSIDGPHGGARNVTRGDEQILIFNFANPVAMRDNIRQSALEVALWPHVAERLAIDGAACDGLTTAGQPIKLDPERAVLMGHSMGATIGPLSLAIEPRFKGMILSGAGGSWIENVMHKRSPIPIRPLAEIIVGYGLIKRSLYAHDPILSLLQWAGESADPPAYARHLIREPNSDSPARHVLMLQGIVDTYILPPIANATSLSFGLDLAGASLEPSLPRLLSVVDRGEVPLPIRGNQSGEDGEPITAVVIQHRQGPIEDGHEVVFQTDTPKAQYQCFLETFFDESGPNVPAANESCR